MAAVNVPFRWGAIACILFAGCVLRSHAFAPVSPSSPFLPSAFRETVLGRQVPSLDRCFVLSSDHVEAKATEPEEEEEEEHHRVYSKKTWKKKRYLMIKDVSDLLHNNDPRKRNHNVRKAEELVRRMNRLYEKTEDEDFRPNLQAYNLWINALAKSKFADKSQRAEEVLSEMVDRGIEPNVVTYTSLIDVYAQRSKEGDTKAPEEAERILFNLLSETEFKPGSEGANVITIDTVLNAWSQQRTFQSAERAEQILNRIEQFGHGNIRPTGHTYAICIHAWSSLGTEGAAKAKGILEGMLRRCEDDPNAVRPDTVVFNAVIDAMKNSGDPSAGKEAMALLERMQELSQSGAHDCAPDEITFNTVLAAWSRSGHADAAKECERILQSMKVAHEESPKTSPAPNTVSYNSVLHAHSKSGVEGAADRAQAILDFMIKSGNEEIAPDVYSFSSVLDALAKSKKGDKAKRARALLDQLLELYDSTRNPKLRPTSVTFNSILNACAFSAHGTTEQQQRDALEIAVQTFSLMRQRGVEQDSVSFGLCLKCFANLMPMGKVRTEMSLQVLEKCCESGLVNDLVWKEVRRCCPASAICDAFNLRAPLENVRVNDLPRSWRRNVRRSRRTVVRRRGGSKQEGEKKTSFGAKRTGPALRNISEPSYQSGRDL